MVKLNLRCLVTVIFLAWRVNGKAKPSELENQSNTYGAVGKGGFFDILESLFDYFSYDYDYSEEESWPGNSNDTTYLLCKNCTVVISQSNATQGAAQGAAQDAASGAGMAAAPGAASGAGMAAAPGAGMAAGPGAGMAAGTGAGMGAGPGAGMAAGPGAGMAAGPGAQMAAGPVTEMDAGQGAQMAVSPNPQDVTTDMG